MKKKRKRATHQNQTHRKREERTKLMSNSFSDADINEPRTLYIVRFSFLSTLFPRKRAKTNLLSTTAVRSILLFIRDPFKPKCTERIEKQIEHPENKHVKREKKERRTEGAARALGMILEKYNITEQSEGKPKYKCIISFCECIKSMLTPDDGLSNQCLSAADPRHSTAMKSMGIAAHLLGRSDLST